MNYFLPEIEEEIRKPLLPPIFGPSSKKPQRREKKPKKPKLKILYDSQLRSKADTILNSASPIVLKSKYRTSRLTQLSSYIRKEVQSKSPRSNSNLSVLSSINRSQRLSLDPSYRGSYGDAKIMIKSDIYLPKIQKSSSIALDSTLYLSGNKKKILEKTDYLKNYEDKKKDCKEVALGTDANLSDSDKISCDDAIEEYFNDKDRLNMRRSSFESEKG